jgi:hypothetical protein
MKAFLKTDFGIALIVTLAWKLVISLVGFSIAIFATHDTRFFNYTAHWDGGWYFLVLQNHYATQGSPAFYPLFPSLVAGLHFLSFGFISDLICGQIINTVAVFFIIVALIKIGRRFLGEKKKYLPLILFLCAPAAFFLHVFYSEATFIALGFWAYYFALQKRWPLVGILLAVLTAARLPSILFIALCGLEFLRCHSWRINKNILWFLLAPLGFVAYGTYLALTQHDFLAMFHAYSAVPDWNYQVFNPDFIETILKQIYQLVRIADGARTFSIEFFLNCVASLFCIALLVFVSIFALIYKKDRRLLPLGIFGLLAVVMFTLNNNIVSVHRYALPILTIYLALPLVKKCKKPLLIGVCIISILLQLGLFCLFASNHFAG